MTEQELKESFELRRESLAAFGDFVVTHIREALSLALPAKSPIGKFLQIPPVPRVKETDSFLEKALHRKKKANPLDEITDQVGVRFVVLMLADIDTICKIVEAGPWHAQKDRDFQEERLSNPDYFAYQSDHYVVRASAEIRWNGTVIPKDIACEIQIRTILQHAYAEMAHSHAYKPTVTLPPSEQRQVKRALAKGSALIEATDDVFGEVKKRLTDYSESIQALLDEASRLYSSMAGVAELRSTPLAEMVADGYRSQLTGKTPEDLRAWWATQRGLQRKIQVNRDHSVFYRDPIVILTGYLIFLSRLSVPRTWPLDSALLEEVYAAMGISTDGIF